MSIRTVLAIAEFRASLLAGRVFGISSIVRYLRNPNPAVSVRLLRANGAGIGKGTVIKRTLYADNVYEDRCSAGDFSYLSIGENCYIGDGVYFDLADRVTIEDDAVISGRVSFVTHADCNRSPVLREMFPRKSGPIRVERGAWLGFGVTVLSGVVVGENAVVSAHALVCEDVEANSLYAGVPAKKKRSCGE